MSGAEAILGIVSAGAGLLSLSIQLAKSAKKLNGFYHSVKDAPKTLKNVAFDLETMSLGLRRLERHRQDDSHDEELLGRCIERCRSCTAELGAVVEKMSAYMARSSRMGKLYTAFKEQDVAKVMVELEHAKTSLQMAFMLYHAEEQDRQARLQQNVLLDQVLQLTRIEARVVARQVEESQSSRVLDVVKENEDDQYEDRRSTLLRTSKRAPAGKRLFQATINLAPWFNGRVWNVSMTAAEAGWNLAMRTYNVRPRNANIFKLCKRGDLDGVRRLLAAKEASLMDVDVHDQTLVAHAINGNHLELARWLLRGGFEWATRDDISVAAYWCLYSSSNRQNQEAFLRLLFDEARLDAECKVKPYFSSLLTEIHYPTLECFQIVDRNLNVPLAARTLEERFSIASSRRFSTPASVFLAQVGLEENDPQLGTLQDPSGITPLHLATRGIRYYFDDSRPTWKSVALEVLRNGGDPSAVGSTEFLEGWHAPRKLTPLLMILQNDWSVKDEAEAWMDIVRDAGLDLQRYWTNERRIWHTLGVEVSDNLDLNQSREEEIATATLAERFADSKLRASDTTYSRLFHVRPLPGTFPIARASDYIAWVPNPVYDGDGSWEMSSERGLRGRMYLEARAESSHSHELFSELVDASQDDAGPVMFLQRRVLYNVHNRRRSSSQPPTLLRTPYCDHVGLTRSRYHSWMGCFHCCFADRTWKLSNSRDPNARDVVDTRACAESHLPREQAFNWGREGWLRRPWLEGFLREVEECQGGEWEEKSGWLAHSYEDKYCPQGCHKADLARVYKMHERVKDMPLISM